MDIHHFHSLKINNIAFLIPDLYQFYQMKRNILYLLFVTCFIVSMQSCHSDKTGTWANGDINSDVKKQIAGLNQKLFTGIMTKNVGAVKAMLSAQLVTRAKGNLDSIINRSAKKYNAKDYEVLDEYYKVNTTANIPDTITSNKGNDADYILSYKAVNEQTYISLLVTKNLPVNCLITVIYGKYGDSWKINILQIGDYSILNKTPQEYYKIALGLYNEGDLLDATNNIILVSQLVNPGGDRFTYKNNSEMKIFYSKVIDEANARYQFPFIIGQVKTKPQIFSISPEIIEEEGHKGVFPLISYKSAIKLTDSVALKAENQEIQKSIGRLFKGIDQNNSNIFYQAYNNIPNGKSPAPHYGFIQKLK